MVMWLLRLRRLRWPRGQAKPRIRPCVKRRGLLATWQKVRKFFFICPKNNPPTIKKIYVLSANNKKIEE
jgi:hypothetical protein